MNEYPNAFEACAAPGYPPFYNVPGTPYTLMWFAAVRRYGVPESEAAAIALARAFPNATHPSADDVRAMAWFLLGYERGSDL